MSRENLFKPKKQTKTYFKGAHEIL